MSETDYTALEAKRPEDRTIMHVLYGMHTFAPFTYWVLAIIAMIVNYIRRADELDAVYAAHHGYMISTFWWSILWLVVTSPLYLLFWVPGFIAHAIVGLWYLYRCIRGWLRFTDGRAPYLNSP